MLNEIQTTQNPAWGAGLILRFAIGHQKSVGKAPNIALVFIVLPMLLHEDIRRHVMSTQLGLNKFEEKFKNEYDLLTTLNDRAIALRELTRRSLAMGIASRLFTIDVEDGTVCPLATTTPKSVVPEEQKLLNSAEKLGGWIAEAPLQSVKRILRLDF
jgi:hypothetical protein